MGRKRRHYVSSASSVSRRSLDTEKDKKLHTIASINEILNQEPVDVVQLRKIAAVRGLVNEQIRAKVWPYLLRVDATSPRTGELKQRNNDEHRDSHVVHVDAVRSLYHFTPDWTEEDRAAKQKELERLINGVVASHPDVFYYQGLHDIAGVLLLVLGEEAAYVHLDRLVQHHLRDFTRPTMDPVVKLVELFPALVAKLDPELGAFLKRSGCPPFFAVTWLVTWHSHDADLATACRLFDVFLSCTPLMPLYVAAVALVHAREVVLAAECGLAEVHHAVQNVRLLQQLPVPVLVQRALHAARQFPPQALTRAARVKLPNWSPAFRYPFQYMEAKVPLDAPAQQVECGCRLCHPQPGDSKAPESRLTRGNKRAWRAATLARLASLAKLTGTAAVVALGVLAASWMGQHTEGGEVEQSAALLEGLTGAVADLYM